jgi:hypothetical protein
LGALAAIALGSIIAEAYDKIEFINDPATGRQGLRAQKNRVRMSQSSSFRREITVVRVMDPRCGNAALHDLHELLMIALCSVLRGGQEGHSIVCRGQGAPSAQCEL